MEHVVDTVFLGLVGIGPYFVPPLMVWGWVRWWLWPEQRTRGPLVSFAGFALATASALLAIASIVRSSSMGPSLYKDPVSGQFDQLGMVLSVAGIVFSVGGTGWRSPIRWHALACSFGMLFFWLGAGIDL